LRNSCSNLDLQNMMGESSSFSNFASSPNATEQNIMYDEWDAVSFLDRPLALGWCINPPYLSNSSISPLPQ
jgi:hypothetical protein